VTVLAANLHNRLMNNTSDTKNRDVKLNADEEAFASWFVDWWRRRRRHLGVGKLDEPRPERTTAEISEIEVWRTPPDQNES
jgi:hypothetical protein